MASSSRAAPVESRTAGPVDETRERLIEATMRCLAQFGIAKTGVIDVVREAGSSRQTAYRYFTGRRGLIYNALLRASSSLVDRVPATVRRHSDPLEILVQTVLFLLRELPEDPILGQAFTPGALASLQPLGSSEAIELSRVALESYFRAVPGIGEDERAILAELVNRIVLSAMLLSQGDPLLRADAKARAKLRSWLGPTVERHRRTRPAGPAGRSRSRSARR